jgi:hypothetical protein
MSKRFIEIIFILSVLFVLFPQKTLAQNTLCGSIGLSCCNNTCPFSGICSVGTCVSAPTNPILNPILPVIPVAPSITNPIPAPVPILCPAGSEDPNFNSLRPYQASPCGGSVEARMCSNDLIFTEGFELKEKGDCKKNGTTRTFWCNPNFSVGKHNLFVDLSNTMLPILGNTEQVKNSATDTDSIDDATKMNEYISWYLNGVNNRAEYGNTKNTDNEAINFSGPIQKLMPQSILEAQRIKTIESIGKTSTATGESGNPVVEIANHNQIAVCYEKQIPLLPYWLTNLFGTNAKGLGKATPIECYKGNNTGAQGSYLKLSNWDTSPFEIATGEITKFLVKTVPGPILGQLISSSAIADRWPKKIPPLPWEFTKVDAYTKAYNEWRGDLYLARCWQKTFLCRNTGSNE